MSADRLIAVELERGRLTLAEAVVSARKVSVQGWRCATAPADLDLSDAEAVGAWVGAELREAKMRGRLVMAASRTDVVLKRLSLPRGLAPGEIPGAVSLQMMRQLTVPTEGAVVDYILLREPAEGDEQAPGAEALAGALPGDRRQWLGRMAKASGRKLARLSLRSSGAAAALAPASERLGGSVLGIVIGRASTELVVVDNGRLVFARAIEIEAPEHDAGLDDFARRLAVEAKRTWMSYRSQPTSIEVERIFALGAGPLARAVAEACAEALEIPGEAVGPHPAVELPADMPERQRTLAAALVGTLVEGAAGPAGFDFASPRRAPDVGARRRQRALLGSLAAVVAIGTVMVYLWLDLQSMKADLDGLKAKRSRTLQDYAEYLAADARLKHLEAWAADVDFVAHLERIVQQMPDPREAQLDTLSGSVSTTVLYRAAESGNYLDGRFVPEMGAMFTIRGHVDRRDIAQGLRERLMAAGPYQLGFTGPDVETRFDYDLLTDRPEPAPAEAPGEEDGS
jgi:Tfp pilus assembly PilM family ATPase